MAGAEPGRTEQIVTNFVFKVLQAVLDSRVPHVLVGSRVGGGDRARKRDRWFNLALGDPPAALEGLGFWHRGAADPMVVDILLLRDGADGDAVIERWAVHYEPSASSSRPGTPSSPSAPFRATPPSPASAEAAATFYKRTYKKCIVLLRSIYAVLRLLPAYKAFRMLSNTTAGSSHHHHHHPHQNCNFNLSYRVSSFAEPFTRAEEEDMRRHDFAAVETQFGQITASVSYRPDLSDFNLESSSLFPPRIISDYVGSPAADPLRAFPSSPSTDAQPTSVPARGIVRLGSGPWAGPTSRPHSWTSTPLAHHPLSASPPSTTSESQNSPVRVFGQRLAGAHQRPISRKGSMNFDDYALSPPFSSSPSPSPPTHTGNPSHRRLQSDTAPMSIPLPALGSSQLHHRIPNFSDPTKVYLPPPSPKVTRADTSFQESPSESRSFRRVEGFKVGELSPGLPGSPLQKGIRDLRDDSGRFSGVPSSCGSPRVEFSRSSSKLSFQDDLDDSCPFAVDDIPDSQLRLVCFTGVLAFGSEVSGTCLSIFHHYEFLLLFDNLVKVTQGHM
ncbi:hypothetical protein Taro_020567 [Colocasia esculenta]|uniref:Autophagy-related protein 13 N-terminal domain-containing protein n=1 Tax=Colocasia esculenta TaxID=4460 RepID=A0A843UWL1_COLES|nr:hypothetical protein [Colocasia esculenta]